MISAMLPDSVAASLPRLVPMDVPVGWSEPESVDVVHAVLVLAGIPLLLLVGITLAVYVPSLVRGERIAPGAPTVENQWIGGPRRTAELTARGESGDGADETGGASGRW